MSLADTITREQQRLFLDITEAQHRYGGSKGWRRKAVWKRQISYSKRGGRVVLAVADLDAYFRARRVPARVEAA